VVIAIPLLAAACTGLVGLEDLPVPQDASTDGTVAESGADTGTTPDGGGPDAGADTASGGGDSGQDATVEAATEGGGDSAADAGSDGAADSGEGGVVPDAGEAGVCVPDTPCTPTNPCDQGTIDCATGVPVCTDTGPSGTSNGTTCGTGEVCDDGGCVACTPGLTCTPTNACHQGTTSCATGTSTCTDTGIDVTNGTSCGAGMLCESGGCIACVAGASCTPTSNACHAGAIDCSTSPPSCTDTGMNAPNGTACGADFCINGACSPCAQGTSCQPANPCHNGTFECTGSTPGCQDTGVDVTNGTACGTNMGCQAGVCCSTIEICDNGVDDNCNGLIDCADPYCTSSPGGWTCTDAPEGNGWTIAAYDQTARPACPPNFATSASDVLSALSGGADTCGCTCTNTKAATCDGTWCYQNYGATPVACGNPPYGACDAVANGACVQTGKNSIAGNNDFIFQGSPTTTAGACGGAPAVVTKPAVTDDPGETCSLPAAGGGCSAGSVCAPTVPSGFQLCSFKTGSATCPNGLVQSTVYAGYSDTRACGACACGGTTDLACDVTNATFYPETNCTGTPRFEFAANTCQGTGGNGGDMYSYQVIVATNGKATDCTVTTNSTPTGAVTATGASTMCCVP